MVHLMICFHTVHVVINKKKYSNFSLISVNGTSCCRAKPWFHCWIVIVELEWVKCMVVHDQNQILCFQRRESHFYSFSSLSEERGWHKVTEWIQLRFSRCFSRLNTRWKRWSWLLDSILQLSWTWFQTWKDWFRRVINGYLHHLLKANAAYVCKRDLEGVNLLREAIHCFWKNQIHRQYQSLDNEIIIPSEPCLGSTDDIIF